MNGNAPVLAAVDVSKEFRVYRAPHERMLQAIWGERKKFYSEFWALRNVNFQVFSGEVVGVIGCNGSGKSTLLQILAGTLRATEGQVFRPERVAALLELGAGFNMEYTGRENIFFNAMLLGLSEQEISERLNEIIQFADIGEFIDRPVRTYSSGMFVRLAFSIAAYVDADVLIVDEALAVGDAAFQFKCLNRLEELLLKGITILLVSHDIQLIKSYCSRAIYLSKGRVIFDGDCETATELYLRDSIETQRAEIRSGNMIASGEHGNSGIAYGNGQGRILSIRMGVLDEVRDYFDSGERVWVEVLVQLDIPVPEHPKITLTIRDQRGYNLYGINNLLLGRALNVEPDGRLRTRISFDCDLQAGEYALTFRLENSLSESVCELMDKQVNAAIFRVFNSPKCFDAVVNLHGAFEPCETGDIR